MIEEREITEMKFLNFKIQDSFINMIHLGLIINIFLFIHEKI